jgi:hypothetical protein
MARSRRRYGIWACFLGLATLTVGIGIASGAKLKTRSDTTTIDGGESGTATAQCDQGTKALSGGFDTDLGLDPGDSVIATYSSLATGGRKWSSSGFNFEDPGQLTSFAYCRDQKVKRRTDETSIAPFERETVTAKCPRGTKAISGGFDNPTFELGPDASVIFPFESRKVSKREWLAGGANLTDVTGTFVAQVTCREGKGLKTAEEQTFINKAGLHTVTAHCKRTQRLISGGFNFAIFPSGDAFVFSSHKEGKRGWEVSVIDFQEPAELTAFAYCEKKRKK